MPSVLEPLYTAAEMRAAEERYPGYPDTAGELMESAGAAVAREAMRSYPRARSFGVVCGGGANGGDGRIAARVMREAGREAVETDDPEGHDVVVDALFGTGFHGAPRPEAAALIERINACGAPVIAVDLPSGVDASTGEVAGAAVTAALTVTFHGRKVGLVAAPGRFHAGRVVVADIGLAPADTDARRATDAILREVPLRAAHDSKYTAGAVLVVGGAPGMTGAAVLTARAALAGRRRLRHARSATRIAGRGRDAGARAGQARLRLARGRSSSWLRISGDRPPSPSGRGWAARRKRVPWSPRCSSVSPCPRSSTPTRSTGSSRSSEPRRRCSPRMRESSPGCSTSTQSGSAATGSRPRRVAPSASGASCC